MDIFRPPVARNQKDSVWERNYAKEERPLQPILIVAGGTADAVASVKTYFNGENPPRRDHSVAGSGKIKFR